MNFEQKTYEVLTSINKISTTTQWKIKNQIKTSYKALQYLISKFKVSKFLYFVLTLNVQHKKVENLYFKEPGINSEILENLFKI